MKKIIGTLRFVATVMFSLATALFIIVAIIPFDRNGQKFNATTRWWGRQVLRMCSVTVCLKGGENLEPGEHYVFVSNHASAFDIPAVLASIPGDVAIVYKRELERIPFFGWGLRLGPFIAIDRGSSAEAKRSLDLAIDTIRHKFSVLLFAEGTRTLTGKLQPFKRGAFHIAVHAGVPVIPLTINGSFSILPKQSVSIRPGDVELILEKPINLGGDNGKEAELQLMRQVHEQISKHYVDQ